MSKTTHPTTPPRRVDWWIYKEDYECAYLGALGFSTRYIQSKTGLSHGKIGYRLKKAMIRRMDYRDGVSPLAKVILQSVRPLMQKEVNAFLSDHK